MLYPCPQCQKLYMPGRPCPSCGYMPIDHGAAIVSWLSQMPPEQRTAAIAAESPSNWPASFTRMYPGTNPAQVVPRRDYEAALLWEAGYSIVDQHWGGGTDWTNAAAFGVVGLAMTGGNQTSLIVTFARQQPSPTTREA